LFVLSGLSAQEREVVEGAIGETQYQNSSVSESFRSVAERIHSREAIRLSEDRGSGWYDGDWVLRYEGTVYWTDLYLTDWSG
ncbi:MAG: hypothetical protein ACQETI_14610, partial [Halobacteriota archaeon]